MILGYFVPPMSCPRLLYGTQHFQLRLPRHDLHQLKKSNKNDDNLSAEEFGKYLSEILVISPDDIYANYQLLANGNLNNETRLSIISRLKFVTPKSISPTDKDVLEYIIDIVPDLLKEKLWNHDLTVRILSFWVYKYVLKVFLAGRHN